MRLANLERTRAELGRGSAASWHTGAQLYAALYGVPVADIAVGEARSGVPMTPSTTVDGVRPPSR